VPLRSERLRSIQQVAENREQEAARELGRARAKVEESESRLKELVAFREEYTKNFLASAATGMEMSRLLEYQRFLGRIDQAVDHQKTVIEQAKSVYMRRQQAWGYLRGRVLALEKVAERYRQQERVQVDRKEQKEIDERAQRMVRADLLP